ncbi:MAG: hypothetical protein HOV94_17620 [Saccharothrix sp.]|nr:hypothetical protein [Saccharothrix sp.]
MAGVAVVFGLCALSFAAGCVLTAVMLRQDPPPDPVREPPAPPRPAPAPPFPPEDYATKPIHRNPVMGLPTALPPSTRPTLALVPDPAPDTPEQAAPETPRRMHVVRAEPADQDPPKPTIADHPEPVDQDRPKPTIARHPESVDQEPPEPTAAEHPALDDRDRPDPATAAEPPAPAAVEAARRESSR